MKKDLRNLYAQDRVVVNLKAFKVSGALTLGRVNYRKAQLPLQEHVHAGAMEICYLERGAQTYTTREREYRLRSGDVFVSFPDEPHGTGGRPEEKSVLYYLILALAPDGCGFLGLPGYEGKRLATALRSLPRRHFTGNTRLKAALDRMILELRPDAPFAALSLRLCLTECLLQLLELAACPQSWEISPAIGRVITRIRESRGEAPGMSVMAEVAGLSVSHFKARFRKETGLPPREFVLREKIRLAREALGKGHGTVTDIAFELWFSSSQYFATVFKRYTGQSPRQIR